MTAQKSNPFISHLHEEYTAAEMLQRSQSFYHWLDKRRSVRHFADRPVDKQVIETLIRAAKRRS